MLATSTLVIRPERPADIAAVRAVNVAAFSYTGEYREQEADLVDALRASPAFVPGLSLVATVDGEVVGHVLFSRIVIETTNGDVPALALAPLAVLRGHERLRIGARLVRAGLAEAHRQGHRVVIVLGHPKYYRRLGFRPAAPLGIRAPWPGAGDAFMALELTPGALDGVRGAVRYPPPSTPFRSWFRYSLIACDPWSLDWAFNQSWIAATRSGSVLE